MEVNLKKISRIRTCRTTPWALQTIGPAASKTDSNSTIPKSSQPPNRSSIWVGKQLHWKRNPRAGAVATTIECIAPP